MHELDAAIRPEDRPQPAHDRAHDRHVAGVDAGSMLARGAAVSVREPRDAGCAVAVEAQQEHPAGRCEADDVGHRSEEHTSELQALMRISYARFCLTKKKKKMTTNKP